MASLSTSKSGTRRILFVDADGERRKVHLGKLSRSNADEIKRHIEAILSAHATGDSIQGATARWLAEIPDRLHGRLAKVDLVQSRLAVGAPSRLGLGPFIDQYITLRTDVKPGTVRAWRQTRALLVTQCGELATLDSITPLNAKAFHAWLSSVTKPKTTARRFSTASVTKYTSFARQFLQAAVDARHIAENPFKGIKVVRRSNKARQRFIDRETIGRVLDGCIDPEFELVIALSRYGGLRIPSELDGLLWQHIDRERGRILVTSPKTERFEGGATREIPLFRELVPFIDAWFEACPEGCEHVLASHRNTESAWRTGMAKLLRRLGIPAWPRIFHNLRASRQTELEEKF